MGCLSSKGAHRSGGTRHDVDGVISQAESTLHVSNGGGGSIDELCDTVEEGVEIVAVVAIEIFYEGLLNATCKSKNGGFDCFFLLVEKM